LRCYNKNNPGKEAQECNLNEVFANRSKEEENFPITTPEIAEAQKANVKPKHCFRRNVVLDKGLKSDSLMTHTWCARMAK
jgi:hypothetical protein